MNDQECFLGIDDNRLCHLRGVGKRAYEIALERFHWPEDQARQMFIVGFLHDIGYEFSLRQEQHEHLGGEILRSSNFKYRETIYDHGDPDVEEMSDALFILNVADMQTDSNGNKTSFTGRLNGIARRYGNESGQYVAAERMVDRLQDEARRRGINLAR